MATFGVGPVPDDLGRETGLKAGPEKPRYIEDDIKELASIDKAISDLLRQREERVSVIKEQHERNYRTISELDEWFHGYVQGRPTEEVPVMDPRRY